MDNIPIHLLQAFVVFNDSKNIVEASARLRLSQPGLSKQLKQLEEFLPAKAFVLSGRKKMLTPYGLSLHARIKEKIGNLQQVAESAWAEHSEPAKAKVRITGRREILDRLSVGLRFKGRVTFAEAGNDEVISSLIALKSEIGIAHYVPDTAELVARPLFREEFQLAVPRKFFTHRPRFDAGLVTSLQQLPCLAYKVEDELIRSLFSFYSVKNPNVVLSRVTENYSSLSAMMIAEMGWAILPSYVQCDEKSCWTYAIPARALPSRQFYLVYRSEFKATGWFKELIGEIQHCIK
ncbi:MAG: LysR family transcriptional regulator [Bdellovibrionota bacterium]